MDLVSGLRFVLALVVVIGLIAGLAWLLRKYGAGRITMGANKGRLAVGEATHIDAKRRLVLIRRDGTEHLILLSPNSETVIETNIEADIRSSIRKIYYALSGNDPVRDRWLSHTQDQRLLDPFPDPEPFPAWLGEDDIDYLVTNFEAGGFRGPLNRYRNARRDYDNLPQMNATPLRQPSCFIGGSRDALRHFVPGHDLYENVGRHCNDQRISRILEGVGHWVQQEAPEEVTATLLSFLETLD